MKNKISFAIVTYHEEYKETVTFKTLVTSFYEMSNGDSLSIYVFDNTPRKVDMRMNTFCKYDEDIEIYYFTENTNKGLPYAYNMMSKEAFSNAYEYIVLLDQDTSLPVDFYMKYTSCTHLLDINCPKVFSKSKLISPSIVKNYRSYNLLGFEKGSLNLQKITCINSGLLINLDFYTRIGGYNEELFLDFCDHDFIDKVKKSRDIVNVLDVSLEQDFSNDVHDLEQAKKRYNLYVRDLKVYYKGRNAIKLFFFVDLPHLLRLSMTHNSLYFLRKRFF
ncbi:hypothetical protein [Myroides marinus]|uniref:hypothetical protein n=1 Tax=Myroides marinus TaxID=703342 RepID=UPI0025774192|nr:hypothetical protein [Myroides marinus]MDM1373363.1 hypothetical protein [Myroides marinus]